MMKVLRDAIPGVVGAIVVAALGLGWSAVSKNIQEIRNAPNRINEIEKRIIALEKPKKTDVENTLIKVLSENQNLKEKFRGEQGLTGERGLPGPPGPPSPSFASFTNSIGMEFVRLPAGSFEMGSPDSDQDAPNSEKPVHKVTISKSFYMGRYEVTQSQWQVVMGKDNTIMSQEHSDYPVKSVSWKQVQGFIQKLNDLKDGYTYRLPTEAEWEYAARAGTKTRYSFGDDDSQLGDYAWYNENADGQAHPVGQKKPNPWGLYDMHGNVWEWVQDWYLPSYDAYVGEISDPKGPQTGKVRAFRGGSWNAEARRARSAERDDYDPENVSEGLGFRCLSFKSRPVEESEGKP